MTAKPAIPGAMYHVTFHGSSITVVASHACEAIRLVASMLWSAKC
jgi:hypothetical protein